jgi:tetratricopeptide (TPR) repeat protein
MVILMRYLKSFLVLALLSLSSASAFAQRGDSVGGGRISGRVVMPDGSALTQSVKISLETIRGVKTSEFTDTQGGFIFRGLNAGGYQIVVEGDKLWETTSVSLELFAGSPSVVTITLKEKKSSTRTKTNNTVSTGELSTDIPPKAKKEFDRASDASREGKIDEAITHLRKAIELFPSYLMAHNDLGALLLEQEKFSDAEAELRKAMGLDPKAFNPQLNLAIVLIKQTRFEEARDLLNRALSLESNSPAARYYLGESLEGLYELDLAVKEYTTAHSLGGPTFAIAQFRLGNIFMKRGKRDLARKAFETYIAEAPKGTGVAEAKRRLSRLP